MTVILCLWLSVPGGSSVCPESGLWTGSVLCLIQHNTQPGATLNTGTLLCVSLMLIILKDEKSKYCWEMSNKNNFILTL